MKQRMISCFLLFFIVLRLDAQQIKIVASLTDFASIASYIGKEKVSTATIAKGNANPHTVELFPSLMATVAKASLYLKCGLGLDYWSDDIIRNSRNNALTIVDCSEGVTVVEKPEGATDASKGDVHPFGNPHYWLSPDNAAVIADNIANILATVDGANADFYRKNAAAFKQELHSRSATWKERMKKVENMKFISYHSSWAYFAGYFKLNVAAKIEPYPGIPSTGNHLQKVVELMQKEKIPLIVREPYFPEDGPKFLNRRTGAKISTVAPSCNGTDGQAYFTHMDELVVAFTQ